jgi:hypothetical protein
LLTYSEEFDNAAWGKTNTTVTANSAVAPDGTTTADTLTGNATISTHSFAQAISVVSGTTYTLTAYLKQGTHNLAGLDLGSIGFPGTGASRLVYFDLSNGTIFSTGSDVEAATIADEGSGWYRCSVTQTADASAITTVAVGQLFDGASPNYDATGDTVLIWGAQLETGSTATAYQRVGTAFDVTEAGVASCSYLSFDGSDDFLLTGNIVPGTDKAQVFAGLRKLSDAAFGTVAEFSVASNTNNGSFHLGAPGGTASATYFWRSRGTVEASVTPSGFIAPITNVLTGTADIAADICVLRANGTQIATNTNNQGTGNYGNYPLYIGRRAGTALPLNGQLFGLIVRFGTNLSAATVTQTETWLANRAAPTVVIP